MKTTMPWLALGWFVLSFRDWSIEPGDWHTFGPILPPKFVRVSWSFQEVGWFWWNTAKERELKNVLK